VSKVALSKEFWTRLDLGIDFGRSIDKLRR
jgi:hypothetical protein